MARIVTLALLFLTPSFLMLGASVSAQDTCGSPAALDDGWTIARQADVGFDAGKLCQLDTFLKRWPQQNIHAVIVARHGKLAMERYFKGNDERLGRALGPVQYEPTVLHDLRSITKSVTSLLIGIARSEGKFPDLDAPAIDQLPQYASLRTPDNARVTLRHLLTMSAGLEWDENLPYSDPKNSETTMENTADPYAYVLQRPAVAPPGTVYAYSSGGSALLGLVLARSIGRKVDDYAREKLFAPLDITASEWGAFGGGLEIATHGGLRLRPRDTAKMGQLLLTDGVWNGRQVLPKGWAAESVEPRINGEGLNYYGYQWWLARTFFRGRDMRVALGVGWGGQRLYAVPDLDLVVMVNAGHYGGPLQGIIPFSIFKDFVLPAIRD